MKKLIVCFALAAIAATPVFAGEKKDKAACADKNKTECKEAGKEKACCSKEKSACKSGGVGRQSLLSPKVTK